MVTHHQEPTKLTLPLSQPNQESYVELAYASNKIGSGHLTVNYL